MHLFVANISTVHRTKNIVEDIGVFSFDINSSSVGLVDIYGIVVDIIFSGKMFSFLYNIVDP